MVAFGQAQNQPAVKPPPDAKRFRLTRAYVIDDRLSALRREADIQSPVMQRLRLARPVFIITTKNGAQEKNGFFRIAITRRTRGWIHRSALALPTLAGEDARVMELIDKSYKGLERITLCRLFADQFRRSPLLPKALLAMAQESDRAASSLNRSVAKRLSDLNPMDDVEKQDYYLSDPGLDRYSRLGIRFRFDQSTGKYAYDGQAYRDIIRLFPESEEAARARARLESLSQRQARK